MSTSEEQLCIKLEAAFKHTVDTEKGGMISRTELKEILNKAGFEPTDNDIQV